MDVQL